MLAYFQLLRPGNVILAAFAVFVGAFVAVGRDIGNSIYRDDLEIAILCSMMLVGGGNALNDYNDRETDRKNHPNRPLPSGRISEENAILYAKGLLLIGLVILVSKIPDNVIPFGIALGGVILLIMYENSMKAEGLPGNIIVGLLSGAVFLYAGSVVGNSEKTMWIFGLAVLATIAREIVKDIQDLEGDTDRNTLPSRIGIERALNVGGMFLFVAIVLSYGAYSKFIGEGQIRYLAVVTLANIMMLYGIYSAKNGEYFKGQKTIKQGMGVAILAFILGVEL